ncbi:MAG: Do family serine endopeptidase [Alphaproteobacteria bacterium]|nr:Do family serine endopeptidase [Alphaproteobacteria bacterium]
MPVTSGKWARRGAVAAAAVATAGLITAFDTSTNPTLAQYAPGGQQTIDTPYGRAPLSFADIVDKTKPAVVSIQVTNGKKRLAQRDEGEQEGDQDGIPGLPNIPEDHPLYKFFKGLPKEFRGPGGRGPQTPSAAQGSGFLISEDGYIVTNNHVIDDASEIEVAFDQDRKYQAELIGTDPRTDLALLKIKDAGDEKFQFVKFATEKNRVGDWVLAVGNPFGLGGTVTAGIISAQGRDIGSGPYDYMQIDAAVNRGNSGGPTFNLNGEVVGVNTAIYSPSGGNVGIAFAVPAATAIGVIEQLKKDGTVSRGWLGVKIQNIDEDTAASLGLKDPKGALVSDVTPQGPAEGAGIEAQDAILEVDGSPIADSRDLARKIAAYSPDSKVQVVVWRGNARKTIEVDLGRFPSSSEELAALQEGKPLSPKVTELDQLGLSLKPASEEAGVSISEVDPLSDAARKGLKVGDVVLEVQGVEVKSPDDVIEGVQKAQTQDRGAVLLHIQSGNAKRFVAVRLKKG